MTTDTGQSIVRGVDLGRFYNSGEARVDAIKNVSFDLYDGEFVVVLGHSGSGKSTLLNIIGGMDRPSSGEIYFKDVSLKTYSPLELSRYRRDTIGFVFQFFNLIPSLTARENIALAYDIVKNPLEIDEIIEMVGLSKRGGHFPSQLSGGEQQRVAIARAIVKNPALLLCDEPTGALDITTGIQVIKLLLEFNRKYKRPVVIITHNVAIAKTAHRVFYMRDGQLDRVEVNEHPMSVEEVAW